MCETQIPNDVLLSAQNAAAPAFASDVAAAQHAPAPARQPHFAFASDPQTVASVREMIDGEERDVYVISDDDDKPPASPLQRPATQLHPPSATCGKRKPHAAWDEADHGQDAKRRRHDPTSVALDQLAASLQMDNNCAGFGTDMYAQGVIQPVYPAGASTAYTDVFAPNPYNFVPAAPAFTPLAPPPSEKHTRHAPRAPNIYDARSDAWPTSSGTQPLDDKDGHFIVREGDTITSRYVIRGLLGQGTFGKVVNCYDRKLQRCVAIKVIRAVQKYRDASQIEIRVLRCLRDHDPSNRYQCVQLMETFDYRNHVCIVSELLDRSVFDFLKDNQFQPFLCRNIWHFAQQLLHSIAFLHKLSLIHTDLKPENVLLVDASFDMAPTSRRSNARKKRVLRNDDIRLIDFGSATFNDEYHSGVVSTRHYRAPEIILGMGWSFPCDAWSLGCILIEFYTGDALFQTHDNLEHLAMMEMVLGRLPDDYRRKAETYKPEYFRNGQLDYPKAETSKQSRRYVQNMKRLEDIVSGSSSYAKHNARFLSLLHRLLEFDPAKRITMEEALKHPYFDLRPNEIPQ
ncbi:Kns1p [Malassezia vespertilionis]|uniref:Kns1p n=2 Tax=Malassezia vespertilionis TaxID=2020962 RepID=A0A2N1JB49_9BASI|nr:Kns1p [Malassezia vespertilionis]